MKNTLFLSIVLVLFACSKDTDQPLPVSSMPNSIIVTINGETTIYKDIITQTFEQINLNSLEMMDMTSFLSVSNIDNNLIFQCRFQGQEAGDYSGSLNNELKILKNSALGWDFNKVQNPFIGYDTFVVTSYGAIGEEIKGYFSTNLDGKEIEGTFNVTRTE